MKNHRSTTAQDQKRSSSIISRIRARHRSVTASDSAGSLRSVAGAESSTGHNMLSTPYSLTMPALLS